jgi:hypothetical protein
MKEIIYEDISCNVIFVVPHEVASCLLHVFAQMEQFKASNLLNKKIAGFT